LHSSRSDKIRKERSRKRNTIIGAKVKRKVIVTSAGASGNSKNMRPERNVLMQIDQLSAFAIEMKVNMEKMENMKSLVNREIGGTTMTFREEMHWSSALKRTPH